MSVGAVVDTPRMLLSMLLLLQHTGAGFQPQWLTRNCCFHFPVYDFCFLSLRFCDAPQATPLVSTTR
jgi:hypothetical protein